MACFGLVRTSIPRLNHLQQTLEQWAQKEITDAFVCDCICICIYKYTNQQQKPCGVLTVLRLIFHIHCYALASDH